MPPELSPLPCSKKRLSHVGDALVAGTASEEDLALYVAALDAYDQRTTALRDIIDGVDWTSVLGRPIDLHVTGRTKTLGTLLDKLARPPQIKLPYIRDVSGVRVVGDLMLREQDAVAAHIVEVLDCPDAPLIDRRKEPESGYRALHVSVSVEGFPAEVQIRTQLQAAWAEIYERQADAWGREMRYGLPPQPDEDGSTEHRVALIHELHDMSLERIAPIEQLRDDIAAMVVDAEEMRRELATRSKGRGDPEALKKQTEARVFLSKHQKRVTSLEAQVDALRQGLRASLDELGALAERVK